MDQIIQIRNTSCCRTLLIVGRHNALQITQLSLLTVKPDSFPLAPVFVATELQELLPGIINELGSENLAQLKELAGNFGGAEAGVGDDDDDVPDLVENFEEASK